MPGGPDYPLDTSTRFTLADRNGIRIPQARNDVQGIILQANGDINNWVSAQGVADVLRHLTTALAYLDVADLLSDERHKELGTRLAGLATAVDQCKSALIAQTQLLQQVSAFLGVVIPAWINLTEVNNGDDLGLSRPSATELGLHVEIIALQREPGFGHEDVVSMDPAAGTLVARGSTVRVSVNFLG